MTGQYAICFDFPEEEGDPWFAAMLETPGFTNSLNDAARFVSEDAADRFLCNSYGSETRSFGAVVEVSA